MQIVFNNTDKKNPQFHKLNTPKKMLNCNEKFKHVNAEPNMLMSVFPYLCFRPLKNQQTPVLLNKVTGSIETTGSS